jgi:hypothetical protein
MYQNLFFSYTWDAKSFAFNTLGNPDFLSLQSSVFMEVKKAVYMGICAALLESGANQY